MVSGGLCLTRSTSGSISSGGGVEYHRVGLTLPSSASPATKTSLLTKRAWSGSGAGSCGSVTSSVNRTNAAKNLCFCRLLFFRGENRGLCHYWLVHFLDNRELKQRPFAATYVNCKWTFFILGQWFCLNFQARKLNNTNWEASMHIIR